MFICIYMLLQLDDWNTNSAENDSLIVELRQELEETKVSFSFNKLQYETKSVIKSVM